MRAAGFIILGVSLAVPGLLVVLWLVGFLLHIGGALIHLLLVCALILGFFGGIAGVVLLVIGKKK